jgi:hypothetical protein
MRLAQFLLAVACITGVTFFQAPHCWGQNYGSPKLQWASFTSKELGFTAMFPGKPRFERLKTTHRHEIHVYKVDLGFPYLFQVIGEVVGRELSKEEARVYLAKETERRSESRFHKSKKEIKLGELEGVEIDTGYMSDVGEVAQRYRFFRIGKMHYSVTVNYPPGIKYDSEIDKFLNSFKPPDSTPKPPEFTAGKAEVRLRDSFKGPNGVRLDLHLMNNGAGWTEYGTGQWRLYDGFAKISVQRGQDVIAADAGKGMVTLTCDMRTPEKDVKGLDAGLVVRMVDNDNYWLVALYEKEIQVYKKAGGAYASMITVPFAFRPQRSYPIKVVVADDFLTVFVSGEQQARVKLDAFIDATKFGLRDNSAANRQPSWSNFQVTVP